MDNGASSYRRFLSGDKEGLSEIIRQYSDGLIFYINSFVRNITAAEDLTEDVFAELIVKKPKFSGKSTFKTWLYSIARNITLDYLKHYSRFSDVPADEMYDIADDSDPELLYLKEEQKKQIHQSVSKLNPDYRQVLHLVWFEGFTNEEAANIMKKSKRQIENLIYRAKNALKAELGKDGFDYEIL
ncbi:MAG: RNA polymerase sigma factor [Oscillospiraceae bacterium]|nr:RNA polymerase sigma factor [Oscillospiraceae bacterium]